MVHAKKNEVGDQNAVGSLGSVGSVTSAGAVGSSSSAETLTGTQEEGEEPQIECPRPHSDQPQTPSEKETGIPISGELPESPLQSMPYDKGNAVWQAAAQRKHAHRRYLNQSIGVASLDLSGPHEATPQPGHKVGSSPAHYFLVLAVKVPKITQVEKKHPKLKESHQYSLIMILHHLKLVLMLRSHQYSLIMTMLKYHHLLML